MRFSRTILTSTLVALLLLAATPLSAQTKVDTNGKWALQFGLESDVRLTSFQGTVLSLQKTTMSGAAWRMGLGLSLSTQDREQEETNPDSTFISANDEINSTSLTLTIQRLFKLNTSTRIRPYFGAGPLVEFFTSSNNANAPHNPIRKTDYDSWSLGVRAALGAEWFVTDYLSLLGEYSLDATYDKSTEKRTSTYDTGNTTYTTSNEIRTDGFHVGSGYAQLAVSLYF